MASIEGRDDKNALMRELSERGQSVLHSLSNMSSSDHFDHPPSLTKILKAINSSKCDGYIADDCSKDCQKYILSRKDGNTSYIYLSLT